MPESHPAEIDAAEETRRDEWIAAVERLIADAEGWSRSRGWRPERQRKAVRDDPAGPYEVPQLWIWAAGRAVFLDPTSRFLPVGKGIADIYLWPEMDAVMIPWTDDGWQVHLPAGRFDIEPLPWSEPAFERAVNRLTADG